MIPFPRASSILLLTLAVSAGCTGQRNPFPLSPMAAQPYAILESASGRYVDLSHLTRRAIESDVTFFGEFHEDSIAHEVQRQLLERLAERGVPVILGMEMFERDVQPAIDGWLGGDLDDRTFRLRARPWPNYDLAYQPLVDIARRQRWPVLATNLPQVLATAVARGGLVALDTLDAVTRGFASAELQCTEGEYWDRFVSAIVETSDSSGHMAMAESDPMFRNMFEAQCARDEAMAETIAAVAGPPSLFVHINGAFHSDFRLGTVSRLLRRRPTLNVLVISAVSLEDDEQPDLDLHRNRADFVIFTP